MKQLSLQKVRVRIAPSPTGPLHIGTARTALFNYLFARKHNGTFILRIEDTDKSRSKREWEEDIYKNLLWLGLKWDEGPNPNAPNEDIGQFGPYKQSNRREIYKKYIMKLLQEGKAYYCFCTPEELEAKRQYFLSIGQPPRYNGTCRNLTKEEIQNKIQKGLPYVIRFKVPSKKIKFIDLIHGKIETDGTLLGDFVIAKNENEPLYNFACVVDDFEMKITHVIRGEDHISNTPKQILLQEALGFPHPKYAHLPLILGPDRSKLSKRHGNVALSEYRKQGYLPEAIINFIALLGWNPGDNREFFDLYALIKEFSLEKCHKAPAVFNIKKLVWFNGAYIRKRPLSSLTRLCIPYLIKANLIQPLYEENTKKPETSDQIKSTYLITETQEKISFEYLTKIVGIYQERLKILSEIVELTDFFFKKEIQYPKELLQWKNASWQEVLQILKKIENLLNKIPERDWTREKLAEVLIPEAEKIKEGDRGYLLWPFRVALTGKKASAGPFEIAEILGKEKTLKRIKKAQKILTQ